MGRVGRLRRGWTTEARLDEGSPVGRLWHGGRLGARLRAIAWIEVNVRGGRVE